MTKIYAKISAQAVQLVGKQVVVHWVDDEGEICAVHGTLKRIAPEEHDKILKRDYPKRLQLENYYASLDIGSVTHIELYEDDKVGGETMNTIERIWMALSLATLFVGLLFMPAFLADGEPTGAIFCAGVVAVALVNVIACFVGHLCGW